MKKIYFLILLALSTRLNAQTNLPNPSNSFPGILKLNSAAMPEKIQSTQYRITGLKEQLYTAGVFTNNDSVNFAYDAGYGNGALDLIFGQYTNAYVLVWDGFVWANSAHLSSIYTPTHQKTQFVYDIWDGVVYNPLEQIIIAYNLDGTMSDYTIQLYSAGAWTNNGKALFVYTLSGALDYETVQTWSGTDWVNQYRYIYTYDGSGRKIVYLSQNWSAGAWMDLGRDEYVYNASGTLATDTYQASDGAGGFNDNLRYIYTYDGSNTLINSTHQTYYAAWENDFKTDFTNNAWGLPDVSLESVWDGTVYSPDFKAFYYYESYEATGIKPELPIEAVSVFPNPVSESLNIQFTDAVSENMQIAISDINGRIILLTSAQVVPGKNVVTIHLDPKLIASGNYFINAGTATKKYAGKFIAE